VSVVAVTIPAEAVPGEAAVPPDSDFLEPADLIDGTYRVAGSIGSGAMGVVYLAVDMRLARTVALKLIRGNLLEPGFRLLFQQEARAMARVNHPNVVAIYSFGEHDQVPYFAMEFVQGESLDRLLRKHERKLPLDLAFSLLDQACRGLSAIHEAGTVHRDIKPSNLLVDPHCRLRILGLATSYGEGGSHHEVVGTPGYIAPEILRGDGQATPRSDLYSLACVAFEVLVGRPPFGPLSLRNAGAREDELPAVVPSAERRGLPAAVDAVLKAALAANPAERPESVEAFRAALLAAGSGITDPVRILLVEDDPDERLLLQLALGADFPHTEIECAGDGTDALVAFAARPASVVISDLQMPRTDGLALTASLRGRADTAEVPIILLTASGGPAEWRKLQALGADAFVVKPANVEDLVSTVRRALRERRAHA
jgi:serine/threonine-protein kinase